MLGENMEGGGGGSSFSPEHSIGMDDTRILFCEVSGFYSIKFWPVKILNSINFDHIKSDRLNFVTVWKMTIYKSDHIKTDCIKSITDPIYSILSLQSRLR
jgi:hypothetical protein